MGHNRLVIIGAGGHGRVVRDIALRNGYGEVIFLDDAQQCSVPTAGKTEDHVNWIGTSDFFVAIGNNAVREKLIGQLRSNGAELAVLVHPAAVLDPSVRIGPGTVVMAGAVINTDAQIGSGVIVNTCSSVDHDCVIGNFCHIAVGAHLCGTVEVGPRVFVGAGATVINNVTVCKNCTIGAGAVIVRDIEREGTYIGVPGVYQGNQ